MVLRREIDPALLAALAGPFHPVVLVHLDWPGPDKIRVHSGIGTISWGGHDWIGVGERGFVSLPAEAMGAGSFAGVLSLGGLPDEVDDYLNTSVRGIDADIYFGAVTERAGTVLIGEPVAVFAGYADDMSDEQQWLGAEDSARMVSLGIIGGPSQRSAGGAVHTYEDQIAAHPDDTGLRWVKAALAKASANLPQW